MAVVAVVAMFALVAVVPPQYTAVSQIYIQPNELRVVDRGLMTGNQLSEENIVQVESQVRVISSDNVLLRVVKSEGLDKDPKFVASQSSFWRKAATQFLGVHGLGPPATAADPTLAALTELRRRLAVKRAERTYVVDVSLYADSPAKAVKIVGAIAQAYLAEQTAAKSDAARRVSDSLQSRLSELRERVRQAEERVEAFKSRQDIVGASGVNVIEQQLADLNGQVGRARNRAREAKARSDQIQALLKSGGNVGAISEAVQSNTIASLRTQYAETVRRQADLTTQLGPNHPFVADIHAQIQGLQRLITEELNRIAEAARNDFAREEANEAALSKQFEDIKRRVMTTNEALVSLRELERDVQTSRALYESFLSRARETGELKGLDTNNVRVISLGEPLRRSWPPSNMILLVSALVFGLGAGTGLAFMREVGAANHPPARQAAADLPDVSPLAELPHDGDMVSVTAANAPRSRFSAEIHKLYAALRQGDKTGQSILVVTPCEDFSAAKVAVNLAAVISERRKVLLIDGDIGHGAMSAICEQPVKSSFVDVAGGRMSLAQAVVCDRQTNIDLIPLISGNGPVSNQLNSRGIRHAFEQAKNYDLIVVAATAREGELGAHLFAMLVDDIVVVVSAGARGDGLDEVYEVLGDEAGKIRGSVITDADDFQS